MRRTLELLREQTPWLEVDEMHGDVALDAKVRRLIMPNSTVC
jgi:malate dehydrogenase (oxaloacetate-decarboxylating)(NADP+)